MALVLVGYVMAELLAFGAVVHYLGFIWALVLLIASSGLGLMLVAGAEPPRDRGRAGGHER
jgi:UPF0716 family protein affecting phage T7 exclusion